MIELKNIRENVSLAPYTTYKIGGKADYFFTAKNNEDLIKAIETSRKNNVPFFVLGCGANILVGDKGFRGLVIHNKSKNFRFENNLLIAEGGAIMEDLINASLEKGLSRLEHFVGIPSSVGGAIRQNLHFLSPDRQSTIYIESVLKEALVLEKGGVKKVDKDYFKFGYDDSILHHKKDIFVLETTFNLKKADKEIIKAQIRDNLDWRNEKQPQLNEFPSCGSIFKKIEGVGAGRLIDKCGLKGTRVGGARISEKHANYFVNTGNAVAKDIRELIMFAQEKALNDTGFKLEPEIGFIGEF
ncbi:MAG: UDP-N-acetylmuramate dehydrogenase [Patescibacteria group bacterium]